MAKPSVDGGGTTPRGGELQEQIDRLREQVTTNRADIDGLQADGLQDRLLLQVLQEQGASQVMLNKDLQQALASSRTIGAAIGILMARQLMTEDAAFEVLRKISNDTNRKLRDVAQQIVDTGVTASAGQDGPSRGAPDAGRARGRVDGAGSPLRTGSAGS